MLEAESSPDDVFDLDRIRRLVELMEEHDLREVDLRQAEHRIRLRRGADTGTGSAMPGPVPSVPAANPAVSVPATGHGSAEATNPPPTEDHIILVRSPMVGTFCTRANPNADPFVKVGDRVDPETTICIIEAMKVFNEIPAETRGKIAAVLVDDEEPVDHGRPLFKIDTRGG